MRLNANWLWGIEGYQVVEEGFFRLGTGDAIEEPYILTVDSSLEWKRCPYCPMLEQVALYREFADLSDSVEDIKNFASSYGLLTAEQFSKPGSAGDDIRAPIYLGERISLWVDEVRAMVAAVNLWTSTLDDEAREWTLSHLQWDASGNVFLKLDHQLDHLRLSDGILSGDSSQVGPPLVRGDLRAARILATRIVERYLRDRIDPVAEWTKSGPQVALQPRNLIGALWLQFFVALESGATYKRCVECGKWMEISSDAQTRLTKLYCGDACKKRAYRARKAEKEVKHGTKRL